MNNRLIHFKKKQTAAAILALLLCALPCLTRLNAYASPEASFVDTENAIHISTAQDLLTFAANCTTDTWSQDKLFILDNDIDLRGTDFSPIPTFGGIFLGQGHTISGFTLDAGSNFAGLFRYVQESGEIYQLSVSGRAVSDEDHSGLALLAGCNYGLISGCHVSGSVSGSSQVGGIAGVNEVSGIISDCISEGTVYGSHLTGGITGSNKGSIKNCTSHCSVNTTPSDNSIDLTSINLDATLTNILTTENAASVTDIGGIAGENSGMIRACINEGNVGYQHVGYNIGGIAGSQTGYIEGCVNYGTLNGRKDIGGIAGQMEPSSELEYTEDTLQKLDQEFDKLHDLLTKLDSDAGAASSNISDQTDKLLDAVENAQRAVDSILVQAGDDFSQLTDLDSLTLSSPKPISLDFLDSIPTPSTTPEGTPSASPEGTPSPTPEGTPSPTPGRTPYPTPESSPSPTPEGSPSPAPTGTTGHSARVEIIDQTQFQKETEVFVSERLMQMPPVIRTVRVFAGNPGELPSSSPTPTPSPSPTAIPTASPGYPLPTGWESWPTPTGFDLDDYQYNIDRTEVEKSLNDAQQNVYEDASDLLETLQRAARDQTSRISERIFSAQSSLNSSFSSIIDNTRLLNSLVDDESQLILDDMQAINDELNVITDLLTNPQTTDPDEVVTDVSDEDTLNDITGKVMNCINSGTINGDLNVGGISGSLSRENDLDPEDDLHFNDNSTLNFRYKERIVVRQCQNQGSINGKKDCIGGIAGEMSLGSIMECLNSGDIRSDGSKIGGIAGSSSSSIRSSSSKCTLSGADKIGGIAGFGTTITDCRSMIKIEDGENYLGSIAGTVDSIEEVTGCYFVEGEAAGIDGISYSSHAESLSYEEFMCLEETPEIFEKLYLKFEADGQPVSTIALNYGESLPASAIPAVPEKNGKVGTWEAFDRTDITFDQTIKAVYDNYITTIESAQTTGNRPLLLAEGIFTAEDHLTVTQVDAYPADAQTQAVCLKVTISGSCTGPYTIRFLIPEGMENPTLELYQNQTWNTIDAQRDGSYYVFTIEDSEFIFSCVSRPSTLPIGIIVALCFLAVLLILVMIYILHNKKRYRKTKQNS